MKITAIDSLAYKPGLYRISVDRKPLGYVTAEDIFDLGLALGRDLPADIYTKLIKSIKYAAYYAAATTYADRRLHSQVEVERYLLGRGCDRTMAGSITKKLVDLGVIDEAKLAEAFIHDAIVLKPIGRRVLELKLKAKQIDPEVIKASIDSSGYDDRAALEQLVAQKRGRYHGDQARLFRYLLRQGFSYGDIVNVIGKPKLKQPPRAR